MCHYWIVFFSPLVSPGLSLLLQAQHESTRTHTNVPLSSSFNFTVKTLVSRKRAANLPAFSPSSVRAIPGASAADRVGHRLLFLLCWSTGACFLLLTFSSVFTNGTVMWGFRARSCSSEGREFRRGLKDSRLRCALFFPIYCLGATLCPGSFLALWWIFALPAHLP